MIPKIIHYVWLGHGDQSDTIKRCIHSWKEILSDYEIIRWDETNYDISKAPQYVKDAYNAKKWAFAADYIRLWALCEYGGIYLDTDTEVLKPLDRFLNNRLFIGTQVYSVDVNKNETKTVTNLSMGVIGAEPQHPYVKKCMSVLEQTCIVRSDGSIDTKVTNYSMSEILQNEYEFKVEDEKQELKDDIVVYPSSVFSDRIAPTSSTDAFTYHWGEMSWFQPKPRGVFYKLCWNLNMMRLYHWIETKSR